MTAARNRADLIAVSNAEYARLRKLIDPIPEAAALPRDAEGWSIRDIIAHRTHWLGLFFSWTAGGEAGEDVQTPAPGYKWNQLTAYNEAVRAASAGSDWAQVQSDMEAAHLRLMACIEASSDERLYTCHLYPWMNDWPLGRWAEAAGASHYRSAAKAIRKMLRDRE